ncbi:ATP phosphoribosyltransferase [Robiginitalea sp. M366]|uniref:ATP phosphoribosyltransferase n=1 Tax=Robiginitalea aestuariiviva TaxID=3036903 RepID=UPI00240CF070|nr:ATP phosphoribosyltransferase [Robiginitalea aestuariiviva]MDG1572966.1 ATP phosphoribosyltransferase [Robiginitalea aestuariiviva]
MQTIKIAVQKSGRLNEDSLKILKDCGVSIDNGRDQLRAQARNFPLEVFYLRNGDIPQYLRDGVVDLAIIGENVLFEKGPDLEVVEKLGFSKCRVSLAVPKSAAYDGPLSLQGKRIATSYPNTLAHFLEGHGIEAETHIINGSVEIAPNIGLADAVCDIVSSGSTLFKNNLREVDVIMKSEAVLAVSPKIGGAQREILEQLRFRIQSVLKARGNRYVLMNVPNAQLDAIIDLLPGMRSPTVLPLAEPGWSSVHTVISQDRFWEVLDEVKKAGAEGILVCPIEKMVL